MNTPRVVLDSNVWLDWLHFRDETCRPLDDAVRAGRLQVISRADCRAEWQRVLGYRALRLDPERQQALLAEHDRWALMVRAGDVAGAALPRCRDPDDQKWLELARDGAASLLLSRDDEVLRLASRMWRDFGIRVCRPGALKDHLAGVA